MAKQPVAGRAKTRLVPPLTSSSAASLYHCFLQDILATVRAAAQQEAFIPRNRLYTGCRPRFLPPARARLPADPTARPAARHCRPSA